MTEQEEKELVENVKAITDRLHIIDNIMRARGAGEDMVLAFQCGHSRLYYPADYVKMWGRLYGVGLGPYVCSEALDSDYSVAPPAITPDLRSMDQIMHPVDHCRAQMDTVMVERSIYEAGRGILVVEDPYLVKRAKILRGKQLQNPRGQVAMLQTRFQQLRNQDMVEVR